MECQGIPSRAQRRREARQRGVPFAPLHNPSVDLVHHDARPYMQGGAKGAPAMPAIHPNAGPLSVRYVGIVVGNHQTIEARRVRADARGHHGRETALAQRKLHAERVAAGAPCRCPKNVTLAEGLVTSVKANGVELLGGAS